MCEDLPTSPGLTKPELVLRQGTEAAVFSILGASMTIIGDPTLSVVSLPLFLPCTLLDTVSSFCSHLVENEVVFEVFACLSE